MLKRNGKGIVLVIEDERSISEMVGDCLERAGYEVDFAFDGEEGLRLATENPYAAILLDGQLPRMDGLEVCRRIREGDAFRTPLLFVTARDALDDKLTGLDAGADDYITKPFAPRELVARLDAMIRRARREVGDQTLRVDDLELDARTLEVRRAGSVVDVTPTGFRILHALMRESPRVVSRGELERELWGSDSPDSDSLRSHMYTLRKAVDRQYPTPLLHTLPGLGFAVGLREQPVATPA